MHSRTLLNIGRSGEDGWHDGARHRLRFVTRMNGPGRELFIFSFLLLVYLYRYTINQINPLNIIKWIKDATIKEKEKDKINEKINILTDIAIKFDLGIAENCITALKEIGKNTKMPETVDFISAQLRVIGENVAKDRIKQPNSRVVISSLCAIGKTNIKTGKFKDNDLRWLNGNNIIWIRTVFEEILRNKDLNNITNNDIDRILNSLYLFADASIKNKSPEEQSNQILDLMRDVAIRSNEIPRISEKHKWVLRTYNNKLSNFRKYIYREGYKDILSKPLKNKIKGMIEETEKLLNQRTRQQSTETIDFSDLNKRQRKIIDYVKKHTKITNKECVNINSVSITTARSDLEKLVDKGILKKSKKKGKNVYYTNITRLNNP